MSNCTLPGFGLGPWGTAPWGGTTTIMVGGPLPTEPPFDIYCVGPCGDMGEILTHPEVTTEGDGSHFSIDGTTLDLVIGSGGTYVTDDAVLLVNTAVPQTWTLEFTIKGTHLPPNFSNLVNSHVFVGASDATGTCAGLFISKAGLAYTGCVHVSGGNLVLDTPVQPLADSQLLVEEGTYFTFRIATDLGSKVTYIYVTRTSDLPMTGHQLRYVLPAILSANASVVPADQTQISVRGTALNESEIFLDSLCLGSGLVIPNLPPRANAGVDQAIRTCFVAQLDGTASFDPEGATLSYKWRLLDAPLGSTSIVDGRDGFTYPLTPPTGFTNRFYSATLGALSGSITGTVLVVDGVPYNVIGSGTDGQGFYAQLDGYDIEDDLSSYPFHLLYQNGLSGGTTSKPTFYPDLPGIYKFDLIVFDGNLFSEPAEVIINVVESPLPRGCIPNLSFLWGYLSDFWNLLEDKERIEVFWGGLAQVAAAEMLNLWQIEYSKSLRDIQRTWRRKWLRYVLSMQEDPIFLPQSTARAVYQGVTSSAISVSGGASVNGEFIDVVLPTGKTYRITLVGTNPLSVAQIANQITGQLSGVSSLFTVTQIVSADSLHVKLSINAPFGFSIASTSTLSLFTTPSVNVFPNGTAGGVTGSRSYRVEASLQGMGIKEGDYLVLDSTAYRIARIVTDSADPYPFQRITTLDDIPSVVPTTWEISGQATSPTMNFWEGLVTKGDICTFEVVQTSNGQISFITTPALGACENNTGTLAVDSSPLGFYLSQPTLYSVYLTSIMRRKYIPIDPLVVDVPYLQEIINNTDDKQVLRRNVDFFVEEFRGSNSIRFVVGSPDVWQGDTPPDHMWAENTYLDNRPTIEANFGIPAQFTLDDLSQLPSNVDYLSAVQGLWYAYFNGPTLFNLRAGTQILLGLPFAEAQGVITEIRNDFSSTQGRILLKDSSSSAIVRSYSYPGSLSLETNPATGQTYAVGDTVDQFSPLVKGVEVDDWVNTPGWFHGYMQQGKFLEIEKFFKFLVRVDSSTFNLSALLFAQSFVLRIKPTYTYPLFVVLHSIPDTEVNVTDLVSLTGTLLLFAGPCFDSVYGMGEAMMFDQPGVNGGSWFNKFDTAPRTVASFSVPTYPITWAYDRNILCPEDAILGALTVTYGSPTLPIYDSIFEIDIPVASPPIAEFTAGAIYTVVVAPGNKIGDDVTISSPATITGLVLEIDGDDTLTPASNTFTIVITKNGSTAISEAFTRDLSGPIQLSFAESLSVTNGDVLQAFIMAASPVRVLWTMVSVELEASIMWAFDTTLPAGTYTSYRTL